MAPEMLSVSVALSAFSVGSLVDCSSKLGRGILLQLLELLLLLDSDGNQNLKLLDPDEPERSLPLFFTESLTEHIVQKECRHEQHNIERRQLHVN
jgi:hypothetical protein